MLGGDGGLKVVQKKNLPRGDQMGETNVEVK